MGLANDIGKISKDAFEYLKRSIDGYKLRLVEQLSLLFGDIICGFVLFLLLFVAYIALLVALVFFLAPLVGVPLSIIAVALLLVMAAVIVYRFRERLFADGLVRHFARIFFEEGNGDESEEE